GTLTIGRGSNCDIDVDDRSISRRHAILSIGDSVTIEDLGSANGTFVRAQLVTFGQPTAIAVGELVVLGTANIILQRRAPPVAPRKVWTHEAFDTLLQDCGRVDARVIRDAAPGGVRARGTLGRRVRPPAGPRRPPRAREVHRGDARGAPA